MRRSLWCLLGVHRYLIVRLVARNEESRAGYVCLRCGKRVDEKRYSLAE